MESPLDGEWRGYYLQRHIRRVSVSAEHAPVTTRLLDSSPPARESLFSFLGPGSRIRRHSDLLNFVVTLYLPLFSSGAWIEFGGETRHWKDGVCMVADSSYYHQSINPSPFWRGLLIIDVWHPSLTHIECDLLGRALPLVNDILRGTVE